MIAAKGFPKLKSRVLSAAAVLAVLGGAVYFFGSRGALGVGTLICVLGVFEFRDLVLRPLPMAGWLGQVFVAVTIALLVGVILEKELALICLPVLVCALSATALWSKRNHADNLAVHQFSTVAALGVIYAGVIPGLALRLLLSHHDAFWFAFLLLIVFCGDIAAYFGGLLIGGPKLMPNVSPNKTVAGAISGLLGSTLAGVIFVIITHQMHSLPLAAAICVGASFLAQSGDLFESLLKRVNNAKDSGYFLPGHGGVLDRLDGVYFAAPLICLVADYYI